MSLRSSWCCLPLMGLSAVLGLSAAHSEQSPHKLDGFNVIATVDHPYGSPSAKLSLLEARALGADAIAIVPFVWQSSPGSPDLVRGEDMTDSELRAAIRDAHAFGLSAIVKPQVWVPGSWAGAVAMESADDWSSWFANYQRELDRIAQIADQEGADALVVGTELSKTTQQPQWSDVIASARSRYHGRLLYAAHNVEEAETISFWHRLDMIGVTLYPPLGTDNDRDGRRKTMAAIADRLDALASRTGKSVLVAEIGMRSAVGAAARPWESAEQDPADPDVLLQAQVLTDWLDVLDRPSIVGVLIWRWLTDPNAGGPNDTDFTVQRKPAEGVLMCVWTRSCEQRQGSLPSP